MSLPIDSTHTLQNVLNTTFYIEAVKPMSLLEVQGIPSSLYIRASTQMPIATSSPASYAQNQDAQAFIKRIYAYIHHARLSYFMPILFSGFANMPSYGDWLSTDDNALPAFKGTSVAIGLKPICEDKIFLEQYLDTPIQSEISKVAGEPVSRQRIFEIGNLASGCAGSARLMIAFLVFYLSAPVLNPITHEYQNKADWVVCTGTDAVRHILAHMGIRSHVIAKATAEALKDPEQVSSWGHYYQHNPLVVAINVADAKRVCAPHYRYTETLEISTAKRLTLNKITV